MHPSRLESGTWIMQDQSLLRMVIAQQKQLQLSDKQILELKELKALPNRSKYEYSYVVSKTGFTEPDFKDRERTTITMDASKQARAAYKVLVSERNAVAVSYTHLTLPTIYSV